MTTEIHKPMQFMTPDQAAEYLQVHKMTVYRLVKKKMIPHYKVGGQIRFDKNRLTSWVEGNLCSAA